MIIQSKSRNEYFWLGIKYLVVVDNTLLAQNYRLLLKSSRNKKDLNDVTASPFSVLFAAGS